MQDLSGTVKDILDEIEKSLIERFGDDLKCLILYGSWAKGSAREDSDLDILVIFNKVDKETRKSLDDIVRDTETERTITIIPSSLKDFQKEKIPLFTAVKREGKVLYGCIDLSINPEPPAIKYSEFFKESSKFEARKIKIAEDLLMEVIPQHIIESKILIIRGKKVMLDRDLAVLYGVEAKVLNQAVKRNFDRFPDDFMFQLIQEEYKNLIFHFGTSSWGGTRKLPYAFTENSVAILLSVLNSKRAI